MAYDVFISYSKHDAGIANAACATLESMGMRCWIAPRDILPGVSWGAAIIQGLEMCPVFILVLSEHSNYSDQVLREVERSVSKKRYVLTFKIAEVSLTPDLEYFLSSQHWLDATGGPIEYYLSQLAGAVAALLGRTLVPTADPNHGIGAMASQVVDDPFDEEPTNIVSTRDEPFEEAPTNIVSAEADPFEEEPTNIVSAEADPFEEEPTRIMSAEADPFEEAPTEVREVADDLLEEAPTEIRKPPSEENDEDEPPIYRRPSRGEKAPVASRSSTKQPTMFRCQHCESVVEGIGMPKWRVALPSIVLFTVAISIPFVSRLLFILSAGLVLAGLMWLPIVLKKEFCACPRCGKTSLIHRL